MNFIVKLKVVVGWFTNIGRSMYACTAECACIGRTGGWDSRRARQHHCAHIRLTSFPCHEGAPPACAHEVCCAATFRHDLYAGATLRFHTRHRLYHESVLVVRPDRPAPRPFCRIDLVECPTSASDQRRIMWPTLHLFVGFCGLLWSSVQCCGAPLWRA